MAARNAAIAMAKKKKKEAKGRGNKDDDDEPQFGEHVPFRPQVRSLSLPEGAPCCPQPDLPAGTSSLVVIKAKIWMVFEEPDSCQTALVVNLYILFLIILSAIVACVETLPGLHKQQVIVWFATEAIFVGFFTLEFILRLFAAPDRAEFLRSGMNWIDVISIMPFYMDLILGIIFPGLDLQYLSILRLARSLRLVKLFRYSTGMQMISHCMLQSSDALQLFTLIFSLLIIVCASAIYYSERGEWHEYDPLGGPGYYDRMNLYTNEAERNPFASVPESLWWCIVTLTTVGYGDVAPVTLPGQCVGFLTILLGVICVAMPLSIIGANFHEINQSLKDAEDEKLQEAKGEPREDADPLRHPIDALCDAADRSEEAEDLSDIISCVGESVHVLGELLKCKRATEEELASTDSVRYPNRTVVEEVPFETEPGAVSVNMVEDHWDKNGHSDEALKIVEEHFLTLELLILRASGQAKSMHKCFE